MEPIDAYHVIREACLRRPELRYPNWQSVRYVDLSNPYAGFCYISSEIFIKLVPYSGMVRHESINHYWNTYCEKRTKNKYPVQIWDLTAEQFSRVIDYENFRPYTPSENLSERASLLYEEVLEII